MYRLNLLSTMNCTFFCFFWIAATVVSSIRAEGTFISRDRVRFLRDPVDEVVAVGAEIEIPCLAECDNGRCLFVTWTLNGSLVPFDDRITKKPNGSLFVSHARYEDEGWYQCVVISSSYGVVLSNRANLKIAKIGKIWKEPENVSDIVLGGAVRFQCQARSAYPQPDVAWYHNGRLIPNDDSRRRILPHGVLHISSIRESDAGVYSCSLSNIAGTISSRNATLMLAQNSSLSSESLKVVHAPESLTIVDGSEAVLECLVERAVNILWQRMDDSPLSSKAHVSSGNLIIPNVSLSDEGTYACVAVNSATSLTLLANLTINHAPVIVKRPEETPRFRGESWRFNCYTSAKPAPEIVWYKNGERLRSHGRIKMFPNEQQVPSMLEKPNGDVIYVRDLLITSIEKDDSAVYQCLAVNYLGSTTAAAALVYQETVELDGPFNLTAEVLPNQRELEITWKLPPLEFNNRSVVFIIHFHESESGSENTMAVKYESCNGDTCKTVCCSNINLMAYTNYTFWVDALLDYNQTPPKFTRPSERVVVRTGDAVAASAAPLLLQELLEAGDVRLSWSKPSVEPLKGDVTEYRIEMKTQSAPGSKELVWWRQPTTVAWNTRQFVVRDVDPNLILYFRVIARTRAGYPPAYPAYDFPWLRYHGNRTRGNGDTASEGVPDDAPQVDARGMNSSSILVQWTIPSDRRKRENGPKTKWSILASRPDDGLALARADVLYGETSVVLLGLKPDTLYQITVHTQKPAGQEGLRSITLAKTAAVKSAYENGAPAGGLARIVVPYPIPYCDWFGPGQLRVRWEKPPMSISRVTLRYSLVPVDSNEPLNVSAYVKTIETSEDHLIFSDLVPGRMYLFAARAQTEYGYKSVYSHDVNCSVPQARPPPPAHIEAAVVNGSLIVWWSPAASIRDDDEILFYHVSYATNLDEQRALWDVVTVPGSNTSAVLHNQNSSVYFVTVSAEGEAGRGVESMVKAVRMDSSGSQGGFSDPTVVYQTSYKEGVVIGVSIGFLCALLSAVVLILRSKRNSSIWIHHLFTCHRRSSVKVNSSGFEPNGRRESAVRCVELKEMQTLLPQLMENAESDAKGGDTVPQRNGHVSRGSPVSLRPSPMEDEHRNLVKFSQSPSSRETTFSGMVAGANGPSLMNSGGLTRSTQRGGDWPRKSRSATSSLPNLMDLEKKLYSFGNRLLTPAHVGMNGDVSGGLSPGMARTGV